jgi:hypothetical protein
MKKEIQNKVIGSVVVLLGLAITLVPFSMLIGWNILTLLIFWFLVIPVLSVYLPTKVSNNGNHFIESIAGLIIFYATMVFMIYEHYRTDYFKVMIISAVVNIFLVSVITLKRRRLQA